MTPEKNKAPMKIVIAGLASPRAKLLKVVLETAVPSVALGQSSIRVLEGSLTEIGADIDPDEVIVASDHGLPPGESLLGAAEKLRTDWFIWSPVHLLSPRWARYESVEQEWAVYVHTLPPQDIREFVRSLSSSHSITKKRRSEIVYTAFVELSHEGNSLARSLDGTKAISEGEIRESISKAKLEVGNVSENIDYLALTEELARILEQPVIQDADLDRLEPLVVTVETRARCSDGQQGLQGAVHALKNDIVLARWRPETATDIATRVERLTHRLEEWGVDELPSGSRRAAADLCVALRTNVQKILGGNLDSVAAEGLAKCNLELQLLLNEIDPIPLAGVVTETVKRIVVVEDNSSWRSLLTAVVTGMAGLESLEVEQADCLTEAEKLLEDQRPALVLVDLGLPRDRDSEVILDGGLLLIKQFSGTDRPGGVRYRHRFVVLTAAENYSDAVRSALSLGVSPWNYLQKKPETWEAELRARVRLALQPMPKSLPSIQLFTRTRRIARVDGVEISLDPSQWSLLAVLAQNSRRGLSPDALARDLYYLHGVDPDSRSNETSVLDPPDRILKQIPHYVSDLREKLTAAYVQTHHRVPDEELIVFNDESGNYSLKAQAELLDRVEEHFRGASRQTVLVVEDDENWGREIVQHLGHRGFEATRARWTEEAWETITNSPPDLVSLDLELPASESEFSRRQADANRAIDFLRRLRQNFPDIPVAILTSVPWRDTVMLEMLRQGVWIDDYLSKQSPEPIARLSASLARLSLESSTKTRILDWDATIPIHAIKIDLFAGILNSVEGFEINATGKGRDILKTLSDTPNVFVSRTELIKVVYNDRTEQDDDTNLDEGLKQHIKRLREVIKEATGGAVPGDEIICGERGVYWLRGIIH